jgi:hypothetical protein
MKRLVELLTPEEVREHLEAGLDPSKAINEQSADLTRKVRAFIEQKVYIHDGAIAKWTEQSELHRSRIISDVKWRVTCIHEASETAVMGVLNFSLGYNLQMKAAVLEGKSCYVIS